MKRKINIGRKRIKKNGRGFFWSNSVTVSKLKIMGDLFEELEKLADKNLIESVPKEIVNILTKYYREKKSDGYFNMKEQSMDYFVNPQTKDIKDMDLQDYSCIPRMHEFFMKGIDGETNFEKIAYNPIILDKIGGFKTLVAIYEICQSISNHVKLNRDLRRKFDNFIEERDQRKRVIKYNNTRRRL